MRATTSTCIAFTTLLIGFSSLVHAEPIGLPVADTAEARTTGDAMATAGGFFGDDVVFCGVRGTYNLRRGIPG